MLRREGRRRLGEAGLVVLPFLQKPLQGRPARRGDPVGRHPAGLFDRDPVVQRKGLRHGAVDDGGPDLALHHGRLLQFGRDGEDGADLAKAAQDAARLALDGRRVGDLALGMADGCSHVGLFLGVAGDGGWVVRGLVQASEFGQRAVDQGIVAPVLAGPDPAQDGRGVAALFPCDGPDRKPVLDMPQIEPRVVRQPVRKAAIM